MQETERIIKLFENLFEGSPWIDVNLNGSLEQIPSAVAAKKLSANRNSIWEIVNHIIGWRLNVLKRINGKEITSPDNNYFETIKETSESAWRETLAQLKDSQRQWINFLKTFNEDDFTKVYPGNNMTYYEHIHGIIQHDAYHLGQIILLSKTL